MSFLAMGIHIARQSASHVFAEMKSQYSEVSDCQPKTISRRLE